MTRPPVMHRVKCWPGPFAQVLEGVKPYSVRKTDRDYRVGDTLLLAEWDPATARYTGREIGAPIRAITTGGPAPIPPGVAILSLPDLARPEAHSVLGRVELRPDPAEEGEAAE